MHTRSLSPSPFAVHTASAGSEGSRDSELRVRWLGQEKRAPGAVSGGSSWDPHAPAHLDAPEGFVTADGDVLPDRPRATDQSPPGPQ